MSIPQVLRIPKALSTSFTYPVEDLTQLVHRLSVVTHHPPQPNLQYMKRQQMDAHGRPETRTEHCEPCHMKPWQPSRGNKTPCNDQSSRLSIKPRHDRYECGGRCEGEASTMCTGDCTGQFRGLGRRGWPGSDVGDNKSDGRAGCNGQGRVHGPHAKADALWKARRGSVEPK